MENFVCPQPKVSPEPFFIYLQTHEDPFLHSGSIVYEANPGHPVLYPLQAYGLGSIEAVPDGTFAPGALGEIVEKESVETIGGIETVIPVYIVVNGPLKLIPAIRPGPAKAQVETPGKMLIGIGEEANEYIIVIEIPLPVMLTQELQPF